MTFPGRVRQERGARFQRAHFLCFEHVENVLHDYDWKRHACSSSASRGASADIFSPASSGHVPPVIAWMKKWSGFGWPWRLDVPQLPQSGMSHTTARNWALNLATTSWLMDVSSASASTIRAECRDFGSRIKSLPFASGRFTPSPSGAASIKAKRSACSEVFENAVRADGVVNSLAARPPMPNRALWSSVHVAPASARALATRKAIEGHPWRSPR